MLTWKKNSKNKFFLLVLGIFFVSNICACTPEQIDLNSASANDLDKLYGVGESRAQSIIEARPFSSVDDLVRVKGIGEITLEKIKGQGLACVERSNQEEIPEEPEIPGQVEENVIELELEEPVEKPVPKVINLNPQTIKSEENNLNLSKNEYVNYGLLGFCVLLGILFLLRKRTYKNEFD
jgi:competence ComEA-like helix-hairpin-helix protein